MVFESGVPLTMVPLEVTHTALATTSVLQVVGWVLPMWLAPWQRMQMRAPPALHGGQAPEPPQSGSPKHSMKQRQAPPIPHGLPPAAREDQRPHPLPAPHGGPAHVLCRHLQDGVQGACTLCGVALHGALRRSPPR